MQIYHKETAELEAKSKPQKEKLVTIEMTQTTASAYNEEANGVQVYNTSKENYLPSDQETQYKQELVAILEEEKTHLQWKKQGLNLAVLVMLTFVNIFRGNKKMPSVFGVHLCSVPYWLSVMIFFGFCGFVTAYSIRRLKYEQWLKKTYGEGLKPGDVEMNNPNTIKVVLMCFIGGWCSGSFGLGGGSIFNPLLLGLGVPPKVASATGMYMAIFSTISSTVEYYMNGMFRPSYSVWTGLFCVIGSIIGMKTMDLIMKKLGRQSPLVFLMVFMLGISALGVLYFGVLGLNYSDNKTYMWGTVCTSDIIKEEDL